MGVGGRSLPVLSRASGRKDWQLEQRQQDGTRSNLGYVRPDVTFLVARIDSPVKCFRFHFARLVASRLPVLLLLLCLPRSRLGGFEMLFQVAAITFALEVLRQTLPTEPCNVIICSWMFTRILKILLYGTYISLSACTVYVSYEILCWKSLAPLGLVLRITQYNILLQ